MGQFSVRKIRTFLCKRDSYELRLQDSSNLHNPESQSAGFVSAGGAYDHVYDIGVNAVSRLFNLEASRAFHFVVFLYELLSQGLTSHASAASRFRRRLRSTLQDTWCSAVLLLEMVSIFYPTRS
jgi:hypothetical protein